MQLPLKQHQPAGHGTWDRLSGRPVALTVRRHEQPPPGARERWLALTAGRPFGDVVFDWCEATRTCTTPGYRLCYIEVWDGELPLALAVVHVLERFSLSKFMGGRPERFFDHLARIGFRPLAFDLAYVELPLIYHPGILFSDAALQAGRTAEATEAVLAEVKRTFRVDVVLAKSVKGAPGADALARQGLPRIPFFPEMRLALPEGGIDTYERMLTSNGRSSLRRNRKAFAAAGGTVELSTDFASLAEAMNRLYQMTCRHHRDLGEPGIPIDLDERFFRALGSLPPGAARIYLARRCNEAIGFALALRTGGELYFTHCGLDYELAVPCRAYFNLYDAMVRDAIESGQRAVNFGPVAYESKRRAGAQPQEGSYFVSTENRWMRPAMKLLALKQRKMDMQNRNGAHEG